MTDAVSGKADGSEPKKGIDLAIAAPEVSPVEGEDYDVESHYPSHSFIPHFNPLLAPLFSSLSLFPLLVQLGR